MGKSEDRYVVGYDSRLTYGWKQFSGIGLTHDPQIHDYCHPMTKFSAERALKSMPCKGARIYKLVEVKDNEADNG